MTFRRGRRQFRGGMSFSNVVNNASGSEADVYLDHGVVVVFSL